LFIAFIGVILIANRIEFEPLMFDLSSLWQLIIPAILIIAGLSLLTGKKKIGTSHYAVLSGLERKKGTWQLSSESYVAILGGIELDISLAELPAQETHLDLTAILGGIEIKVPRDLTVICEGQSIFGGVEQLGDESGGIFTSKKQTRHEPQLSTEHPNYGKVLKITSSTVLGGIEIDFA
jgi:predicted membrane protein